MQERIQAGKLVASVLVGAWRHRPPAPQISNDQLTQILPLLLKSGSGGLGWWKLRNSELEDSPAASQLKQAFRHHTLRATIREQEIKQVTSQLRSAGLEPLLGKGWAVGRLYPKHGLRPYGDIDFYIRPGDYSAASQVLGTREDSLCSVDLHRGPDELDDRSIDDLYERSQLVSLGETPVRVLGPEDHLRLLCLHTLRHGAWRPLWLCDISVTVESRPADFDWGYCLSGNQRRSHWVACTVVLAHELLGTQVEDTPIASRATRLPHWLVPTVLQQWGEVKVPHGCRSPMKMHLRHPRGALAALRLRWPNAIEATVGVRGPFNDLPRLPFQIGEGLLRTAKFLAGLPKSIRTG